MVVGNCLEEWSRGEVAWLLRATTIRCDSCSCVGVEPVGDVVTRACVCVCGGGWGLLTGLVASNECFTIIDAANVCTISATRLPLYHLHVSLWADENVMIVSVWCGCVRV